MLNLFSPLTLGHIRLSNRIALTALPSGCATLDGFVSDELAAYYLARARGGVGMLVVEPTYVLAPADGAVPHVGLYADTQVSDLHHCISLARAAGPAVLVMLDQPLQLAGLQRPEVGEIGEAFIVAAWRARAAGADGVMFSCADGGPFEQLVSPLHNQRNDRYGGGTGGRLRLLLDVIEGISSWMGSSFLVGIRLNADEFTPGGLTLQDTRVIAKRVISAGVKLLEVSANINSTIPVARFPGWRVPLAVAIKTVVDVPVMVGELRGDAVLADSVIRDSCADLVALSETLRSDPDWPQYARAQLAKREEESQPAPPDDGNQSQPQHYP